MTAPDPDIVSPVCNFFNNIKIKFNNYYNYLFNGRYDRYSCGDHRLDLFLCLEYLLLSTDFPELQQKEVSLLDGVSLTDHANSTEGFSVEFATLNPQGFFFYSLYTVAGYVDPIGSKTGGVETNDLFFALHAFIVSSIQLSQIFVYGKVNIWVHYQLFL